MVEHSAVNRRVVSSSLTRGAIIISMRNDALAFGCYPESFRDISSPDKVGINHRTKSYPGLLSGFFIECLVLKKVDYGQK